MSDAKGTPRAGLALTKHGSPVLEMDDAKGTTRAGLALGPNGRPMQEWWKNGHKDYINGNPDFSKNEPVANGLQLDHWGGADILQQQALHERIGLN